MAVGRLNRLVAFCHNLLGARPAGESTDGHLLERFATQREPAAFEELLRRHGSLVLGVCRGVLRDAHDAEDAFQATFLVLLRRAGALERRASVAGWLYTVAYHIALRQKAAAARRRTGEGRVSEPASLDPVEEAGAHELRPLLDEEISRLPEKYRAPILLCYLQGKTNDEAAQTLGWPVGTVSGRLARARDLLRTRLVRRGITLAAVAPALAVVPPALAQTTVEAARHLPTGTPLAALVDGAVRELTVARVTRATIAVLCLGAVLTAAGAVILPHFRQESPSIPLATEQEQEPEAAPAVVVRAVYPGANALDIAETVAARIEEQVQDIEGVIHMTSQCYNDGSYTLTVTFARGTDLDQAVKQVQNRVALAEPKLPEILKRQGIIVKKKAGDVILFVLVTADGKHDTLYLSNYATLNVKDVLEGAAGVGDVLIHGQRDYSMRVWLNPEKLAARGLTVADVARVLEQQNARGAAGKVGQPPVPMGQNFQLQLTTPGRLEDREKLGEIVVKTDKEGRTTKLKNVAEVRPGTADSDSSVYFNGKAAVVLSVAPAAGAKAAEVGAAVRARLAELREKAPPEVHLEAIFDATQGAKTPAGQANPRYLRLDVTLMDGASRERTLGVLKQIERLLAGTEGIGDVLAICGGPAAPHSNHGCLLVGLTPAFEEPAQRERLAAAIRSRLHDEIRDAIVRVADLSRPGRLSADAYAIAMAVCDEQDRGPRATEAEAQALASQLSSSGKFTDVNGSGNADTPMLSVEIDRVKVKSMEIALDDVNKTIQLYLGSVYDQDYDLRRFGRNWQLNLMPRPRQGLDFNGLTVRSASGELVPLGVVARFKQMSGPATMQRFNNKPMVMVTANLRPGVTAAEARALCEATAREVLPVGYQIGWLHEPPSTK